MLHIHPNNTGPTARLLCRVPLCCQLILQLDHITGLPQRLSWADGKAVGWFEPRPHQAQAQARGRAKPSQHQKVLHPTMTSPREGLIWISRRLPMKRVAKCRQVSDSDNHAPDPRLLLKRHLYLLKPLPRLILPIASFLRNNTNVSLLLLLLTTIEPFNQVCAIVTLVSRITCSFASGLNHFFRTLL